LTSSHRIRLCQKDEGKNEHREQRRRQNFGFVVKKSTSLIDFVGKKSTSLIDFVGKKSTSLIDFVGKKLTSLIGFVGKKSTSLDSEVDEEQEIIESKKNKFAEEEKIEREKRRPNQEEMTISPLHKRRVVNVLVRGKMVILCKIRRLGPYKYPL
jgi:hypothetical protein